MILGGSASSEVVCAIICFPTGGYRGTLPLYATWETVTGTELLPGMLQCHIFATSARINRRGVLQERSISLLGRRDHGVLQRSCAVSQMSRSDLRQAAL